MQERYTLTNRTDVPGTWELADNGNPLLKVWDGSIYGFNSYKNVAELVKLANVGHYHAEIASNVPASQLAFGDGSRLRIVKYSASTDGIRLHVTNAEHPTATLSYRLDFDQLEMLLDVVAHGFGVRKLLTKMEIKKS